MVAKSYDICSTKNRMLRINEKGSLQFLIILILGAGLIGSLFLVNQYGTRFFSKAAPLSNESENIYSDESNQDIQPSPTTSSLIKTESAFQQVYSPSPVPVKTSIIKRSPSSDQVPKSTSVSRLNMSSSGTLLPSSSYRRVFITSKKYNGNLGGIAGADAKCQERANAANLDGSWKAWLSDSTISVSSRLEHSNMPYKLINDVTIADNWSDLTDGTLKVGDNIYLTELGINIVEDYVWTGTHHNGDTINPEEKKCDDWSSSAGFSGHNAVGDSTRFDYGWSWGNTYDCSNEFALYCFEQF